MKGSRRLVKGHKISNIREFTKIKNFKGQLNNFILHELSNWQPVKYSSVDDAKRNCRQHVPKNFEHAEGE